MLKYLKKLFEGVTGHEYGSGHTGSEVNSGESVNTTDSSNRVDRAGEIPIPIKENNASAGSNEEGVKNRNVEETRESGSGRIRGCRCTECDDDSKRKRPPVSANGKRKRTMKEKSRFVEDNGCPCQNCEIVSTLGECVICLASLQTRSVKTCPVCSNILCSKCSEKLDTCPFCRSSAPMEKNGAVERLLGGLFLPCKNFRNGCRKMLNSEMRFWHEACCDRVACPLSATCCWIGSPSSILGHLKKTHGLKPLANHGLAVEVSNLREETMIRRGEYTIYLSCYGQLFSVKVTLRKRKLTVSISQMGYVTRVPRKLVEKKYAVWMKIRVAGKEFREVLSFGKFDQQTRRVEINCVSSRDPIKTDHERNTSHGEDVRIEISIKEI